MLNITNPTLDNLLSLGQQKVRAGQYGEAEALYRRALQLHPNHPHALFLLACLAVDTKNYPPAIQILQHLLANKNLTAQDAPALHAYGLALAGINRMQEALNAYHKAVELEPAFIAARNNLGVALQHFGQFPQAAEVYKKTVELAPADALALNNLGVVQQHMGHTDQAVNAYRQFLKHYPNHPAVHSNLGTALQDCGLINESLTSLRRAIELDPNLVPANSALLIILQYHPDYDARAIYLESKKWNDTLVKRLVPNPFTSWPNSQDANAGRGGRKLRIGYVSSDLRDHSVGRFMAPLLTHHDHKNFDIFCYNLATASDHITARLRQNTDTWRDSAHLNDDQLAEQIRTDQIDVLIDLAMHTHGGRPLLFARKPAPIQAIYLAYAGTTGLTSIDYRLSDPYLDPPETLVPRPSGSASLASAEKEHSSEQVYSEQTLLLPRTYWCYEAPADAPPVNDLPALSNNYITFGCLNNFAKLNESFLQTWATLLAQVPDAHLLLFCPEGDHRNRVLDILTRHGHGVPADHIDFVTRGPFLQYLQHYNKIDIALDSFPYCGGTTTCDALYMGVPVITLRGPKPVARAGASILTNALGTDTANECIADTPVEYIARAKTLAANLPHLADLRRTLRPRTQSSPLMNAPQFAHDLEQAYLTMWQTWCTSAKQNP